eukprot:1332917-Rhodomonas_salina.4
MFFGVMVTLVWYRVQLTVNGLRTVHGQLLAPRKATYPCGQVETMVFLHASGSYFGQNYCAVVTGPEDAAGKVVSVQGQRAVLKMGKCNPLMMGGGP